MKRLTLFFSLFFICLVVSKAGPVSRSQALLEAKAFLSTKGIEMKTSEATYRAPRKTNAQDAESSYYYIFNVGNDQGFVIVSGDDRTEKILGYSDSGSFDEEDMPEPLKEWFQGYEMEMESIVEVDASEMTSLAPRKVVEKTKKTIAPLTKSTWGAGYPYSDKTPMVSNDDGVTKHAPTGCVATAMAQLLYYYKADNVKKTLADINSSFPAGTVIDWDNMLDDYPYKGYTTTQKNAVANLMIYCGRAIGSSYKYGATSANEYNVLKSLCKHFGYNDSMAYIDKHYYSESDWEDVIYEELANSRPVFFGGSTNSARHLFLIDGYDCNGLFHVNWGWRGKYNGFFCLSVLNRLTSDCKGIQNLKSYTRDQAAVLYISPKSNISVNTSNGILSAKVTSASGQIVTYQYENQSGISGSYLFGIGYLDSEGNAKLIKQYSTEATSLSSGSSSSTPLTRSYTFKVSDFSNLGLSNGMYSVVPMYQLNGNSEWKVCQYPKSFNTIVSYTGSTVTASSKANLDLSATIKHYGNGLSGSEQKIRATIHNNSRDYGYNGNVYLFASTTTTKGASQSSLSMYIGYNNEVTVELPFTPTATGKYTIWISTDASCSNVIGTSEVEIKSASKGALTLSVGYTSSDIVTYNSERTVWGTTCTLVFNGITNNTSYPIEATFTVWIRQFDSTTSTAYNSSEYTTNSDNAEYYTYDVLVPAKSSITIPVTFEDLKPNTKYDATIVNNGTTLKKVTAFVVRPGVTSWYADGTHTSVAPTSTVTVGTDVVAVDITNASTVTTIKPDSTNKNILYYLGASQTVPSGLSGYNVVKGDVAEKVTLEDGQDFFVPKRFTAKSISYTIQPKYGVSRGNNNHWNAIALPFEVDSVMNTTDNVKIDWFRSDSDTGKNFWIRKFDKLDTSDNSVIFENAEKMLAYEPYIMNVPDDYWGKRWDLRGKKITFYGENAVLHHEANEGTNSSYYNFVGTTVKKTLSKAWFLNDAGDTFKYSTNNTIVPAFHAFFALTKDYFNSFDASKASLRIKYSGDDDGTTGIMAPFAADEKEVSVYNLNGVKVATKKLNNGIIDMSDMPKGIYVVNGKKFIQY